jgi:signal peptidase I
MKEAVLDGNQAPRSEDGSTVAAPNPGGAAVEKKRAGTDWWGEIKGIFWLVLIVLGFHSFVAKPFYIPSESMLPGLRIGDRLVVSKFAYGWSFVSPTIPDPAAIFRNLILREPVESWSVKVPFIGGRLLGSLPERGDVVIVTPPGTRTDYIKRVIGLPGDRLEVRDGVVILNGTPIRRGAVRDTLVPVDANTPCSAVEYPGARETLPNGEVVCRLPTITETLPNGRSFPTIDLERDSQGDDYAPVTVPTGHVFLMGDNRDRSADSRFQLGSEQGLGGPVPYENIGGRAEFVTFSLDGTANWNPLTWWGSLRGGRAGTSLHPAEAQ